MSTELTQATFDRLSAEFKDLTTRGRIEIAQQIERARELGDLKENGDYHAAKDEQGKMEARIRQLQAMLDQAVIVEPTSEDSNEVVAGMIVEIQYEGDDFTEKYYVGSIEEKHFDVDVISPTSPMGSSLLGAGVGDTVSYEAPSGELKVKVVSITAP